jgi:trigger factor
MGRVAVLTQVEELPDNQVRLSIDVPPADMHHAVEHAADDLAASLRIPGFRKGKVPKPVLLARIGRERIMAEAVESHIAGWYRNAVASSRVMPVAHPHYDYELPESEEQPFSFTATVAVQPTPEPADWTQLEVPRLEPQVPEDLLDAELDVLRRGVAPVEPVQDRPAKEGDVLLIDLVGASEAQRDYIVEVGAGRLVEELEEALLGMRAGETKTVEYELADDQLAKVDIVLKEIGEKVLPPLDDDLARSASEFGTLGELRGDIERELREQLEAELETQFRATAVDTLVEASNVRPAGPLVDARTRELIAALERSLERRGISLETYLAVSNEAPEAFVERLRGQAANAVARELVLEAVADKLGLEISDDDVRALIRDQADAAGEENPDAIAEEVFAGPARERLRDDLRLRAALDRVAAEVKPIAADLAAAREKLWTPEKEKTPSDTKLWTPATTKERA